MAWQGLYIRFSNYEFTLRTFTKKLMSLRAALLVLAAKQSPVILEIASDKEQERPRKDIPLLRKVSY